MDEIAFFAAFYGLGFVGLIGLTALWIRAWQFGRSRLHRLWFGGVLAKTAAVAMLGVFAYVSTTWLFAIRKVFRCLTDPPCGPSQAAGWIALGIFGATYLVFEILLFGARRWPHGA